MGSSVLRLVRGLLHRGPATALLALLAVVAAGAAAAAPAYRDAARRSIVRDALDQSPPATRQLEVTVDQNGPGDPDAFDSEVRSVLTATVPARLLAAPVVAVEVSVTSSAGPLVVVSRTGTCAHLVLIRGRCPTARGEAVVSDLDVVEHVDDDALAHLRGNPSSLSVVGVYHRPLDDGSFFSRYDVYFPPPGRESLDAVFVTPGTAAALRGQTTLVSDVVASTTALGPGQLDALSRAYLSVSQSPALAHRGPTVSQILDTLVVQVHQQLSGLDVPIVVATVSLVILSWLLLFLVVAEEVEGRVDEIALARLRGLGVGRVVTTAVGEPLTVLAFAAPLGAVAGWALTRAVATSTFAPGVRVGLPWVSWAAAGLAVLGGVAAAGASTRSVLADDVLPRLSAGTSRGGPRRTWVLDAVLLTAAVAGLVELGVTGAVSSSRAGLQVELVPALLALAVAVVTSRALPPACRWSSRRSSRAGLPLFLALRHVGRRPGGTRSVMVLVSAVAIAVFGVSAWTAGRSARSEVARLTVGAPTVLAVQPPAGADLDALVASIDPSGRRAVAVTTVPSSSGTVVAADPARFAAVAQWPRGLPLPSYVRALAPAGTPPVLLRGDAVRITLTGARATALLVSVSLGTAAGQFDADLDAHGDGTYTIAGLACPCRLGQIAISDPQEPEGSGAVVLAGIADRLSGHWRPLGHAAVVGWRPASDDPSDTAVLTPGPGGLAWRYATIPGGQSTIRATDVPDPVPAVTGPAADGGIAPLIDQPLTVTGLDGRQITVAAAAVVAAVPGAPADGVLVDRSFLVQAAGGVDTGDDHVWLAAGGDDLERALRARGVTVLSRQTTAGYRAELGRQGPALVAGLLLTDACVAAGLAAVGAAVSLVAAGRRRRYEYAALVAAGARRSTIRWSLLWEQGIVLAYGVVVGVATGVAGSALTVPRVPVLVTEPIAPVLHLGPSLLPVAVTAGVALLTAAVAATLSAAALMRTVRPAALREGSA